MQNERNTQTQHESRGSEFQRSYLTVHSGRKSIVLIPGICRVDLLCDMEKVLVSVIAVSGDFKIGANVGCKAFDARSIQRFIVFCNCATERASVLAVVCHSSDDF